MTVGSIPPGGTRPPQPAKPGPAVAKPAQSFAEIIGRFDRPVAVGDEALMSALVEQILAGELQFNLPASIAADAIRFDARPMVGATSISFAATRTQADARPGITAAEQTQPDLLPVAAVGLEQTRTLIVGLADQLAGQRVGPSAARVLPNRAASAARTVSPSGPVIALGSSLPAASTAGRSGAAARAQPPPPTSTTELVAKLAMHPQEILLVIHGANLDGADLAALADELSGLLAGTRFADRPVRIVASGRRV